MNASRSWLVFVIAVFCLPLFLGLGRRDFEGDEGAYAFGADRILETGDWQPRASPDEENAFLEKPPLTFWIAALPIRLGLMPHDEFGLRFWDPLFGSLAFVYVFLIGARLFNPLTGVLAVLMLFTHEPLLFDHGLRDLVTEAPLFLSYCGGVFHFLAYLGAPASRSRTRHAVAAALFFTLGFMVKFVAALFLPAVLLVSSLLVSGARQRVLRDWRLWTAAAALTLALIAPWFVYAHLRYGYRFWHDLFGEHVYRRFTAYLDPGHVQPWYFYPKALYEHLWGTGFFVMAIGGFAAMLWRLKQLHACRAEARPLQAGEGGPASTELSRASATQVWIDGVVVIVWASLPIVLMSIGTSKLYYYAYPFLPAYALGAGYAAALLFALVPAPFRRGLRRLYAFTSSRIPRLGAIGQAFAIRAVLAVLVGMAAGVGVAALIYGPLRVEMGGVLLKSSGTLRPALAAFAFALPLGLHGRAARVTPVLLVLSLLPLGQYRISFGKLFDGEHPYRSVSQCLVRLNDTGGGAPPGLFVASDGAAMFHPINYYYRRVRPWIRPAPPAADAARAYLASPDAVRPVLVSDDIYDSLPRDLTRTMGTPVDLDHDLLLLLPGPYAACRTEAGATARSRR